jgi:hypothetical protein
MNMKRGIGVEAFFAAALALATSGAAEDGPPLLGPKTYGTSQDSIYHVPVTEFVPRDSSTSYADYLFANTLARSSGSCTGQCFEAVPRLPNGALLTKIEAYFCNTDANPTDLLGVHLYKSWYDGTNMTELGSGVYSASSNGCGEDKIADLTSLNYQVNYYNNQLVLMAEITATNGTQALAGVNLYYRLEVSPAPATPTFNDVPTTNPQFQFIEALAASGITVGCGGGNYCPDSPLTRGQMAVYLAKALGLQWP